MKNIQHQMKEVEEEEEEAEAAEAPDDYRQLNL